MNFSIQYSVFRKISGRNRKGNPDLIAQTPWLRYSPSTDTVYCCYCVLFGTQSNCFRCNDWSNIGKLINKHKADSSTAHHTAVVRGQAFLSVQREGTPNIAQQLHQQRLQEIEQNRCALKSIVEVLIMMAKQNIAIRGHVPEESNFHATLSLVAKHNSILRNQLEHARPTAKYTSTEIQNELLDIAASKVQCFAFIADESTDVGVKEQISLCARFVDKNEAGKHYVREDFLTFVHAENGTTAEALTTKFLAALNEIGLHVGKMRAQGYDGASVMSGNINGVQTRVRRVNPKAVYIHCRAHVLNLCIVHASKISLVRNIMDTMQSVSLAFKYSAKRVLVFEEQLGNNAAVREEMGRRTKLKVLCETRWASRADCLDVFVTSFQVSA